MTEPETTGTTGSAQDGAANGSGTPVETPAGGGDQGATAEERAELEALRQQKDQWLREKDNTERIRRENEELRRWQEQTSRATTPPIGYGAVDPQQQQVAQDLADLQERDPAAVRVMTALMSATNQQLQRQEAAARYQRELDSVPASYRERVDRLCRERNIFPSLGLSVVRADEYDKKERELAEQSRKLQEEAEKRQKGVVRTDASPAPPAQTTDYTYQQYVADCAAAPRGDREARRRIAEYDAGRLKIRAG